MRIEAPLKTVLSHIPNSPGVYLMKDAQGKVLYIGKAKALKKRLVSHFHNNKDTRMGILLSKIKAIEYQLCANESVALLLEYSLIHALKPRYNIVLQDDKSYPLVKITNEEYPRVCFTRSKKNDGARYFVPTSYSEAH